MYVTVSVPCSTRFSKLWDRTGVGLNQTGWSNTSFLILLFMTQSSFKHFLKYFLLFFVKSSRCVFNNFYSFLHSLNVELFVDFLSRLNHLYIFFPGLYHRRDGWTAPMDREAPLQRLLRPPREGRRLWLKRLTVQFSFSALKFVLFYIYIYLYLKFCLWINYLGCFETFKRIIVYELEVFRDNKDFF